jgi:hypothetical protein
MDSLSTHAANNTVTSGNRHVIGTTMDALPPAANDRKNKIFPVPPRTPVSSAYPAPFLRLTHLPRFLENKTHSATGARPSGNNTWFIQGESRSTITLDWTPQAPHKKMVSTEKSTHAGGPGFGVRVSKPAPTINHAAISCKAKIESSLSFINQRPSGSE